MIHTVLCSKNLLWNSKIKNNILKQSRFTAFSYKQSDRNLMYKHAV